MVSDIQIAPWFMGIKSQMASNLVHNSCAQLNEGNSIERHKVKVNSHIQITLSLFVVFPSDFTRE